MLLRTAAHPLSRGVLSVGFPASRRAWASQTREMLAGCGKGPHDGARHACARGVVRVAVRPSSPSRAEPATASAGPWGARPGPTCSVEGVERGAAVAPRPARPGPEGRRGGRGEARPAEWAPAPRTPVSRGERRRSGLRSLPRRRARSEAGGHREDPEDLPPSRGPGSCSFTAPGPARRGGDPFRGL